MKCLKAKKTEVAILELNWGLGSRVQMLLT